MKRIITISREFGSGGRELGKRLADAFGIYEVLVMIIGVTLKKVSERKGIIYR